MTGPNPMANVRAIQALRLGGGFRHLESGRRPLAETVEQVKGLIERLEMRVPPSSRVGRLVRFADQLMRERPKRWPADPKVSRLVFYCMLELESLASILSQFQATDRSRTTQLKLRTLILGEVLPEDDRDRTPGRDVQWELELFSIMRRGGLRPRFDEPDLVVQVQGLELGIAAKRVKSWKKAQERVSEAGEQIVRSKRPGIVALEFTSISSDPPGFLVIENLDRFIEARNEWWNKMLKANRDTQMGKVDNTYVWGLLFTSKSVALVRGGGEPMFFLMSFGMEFMRTTDPRFKFLRALERGMQLGREADLRK